MNTNNIEKLSVSTYSKGSKNRLSYPYNYQPLEAGKTAPSFSVYRQCGILGEEFNHSFRNENFFSLPDFLDYGQPLVVLFSGAAARNVLHTKKLENLQDRIQQQGGKLLVLTPAAPKYIRRQSSHSSSLTVFHDGDNEIAESFGLYNEQNPLWQWVSGIDEEEETLPAFFVIAPDKTVTYRFVDFDFTLYRNNHFSSLYFIEEILDAVQQVSASVHQTELYQLVS